MRNACVPAATWLLIWHRRHVVRNSLAPFATMANLGDRRPKLKILSAFEKLGMAGKTFEHADLSRVDLSMADLRLTRFVHVSLQGCDFTQADLRGAMFIACDLRGATFRQTRLSENRFDGCWFVGARGLSLDEQRYVRAHGGLFLSLAHELPQSDEPE
jgi:uncharacterized protein YjbI with pentapeptide repeats